MLSLLLSVKPCRKCSLYTYAVPSWIVCFIILLCLSSASVNVVLNFVVSWKDLTHGTNTSGLFFNIVWAIYFGIALNPKIDVRKTGICSNIEPSI